MMTLLDAKAPKPKRGLFKYIPLPLFILILAAVAGFVTWSLWNYPEKRAVSTFLTTLEKGDYKKAYQLWQPAPSYAFSDFMHDWGPQGDYGKVRSFEIVSAKSQGSHTVEVKVRVNDEDPPLGLLVDRKTKGLSYSVDLNYY
ncbi:MAG TPA: hypothetical protein VFZ08_01635 [Terriglobia bacterium]|nr:hypothetical protein [Terriglobia bacterium]